ncbi:MAG: CdvA-like protein, partial [Candidatus Nitrosomaritimum yanchengensis]
KLASLDEIEREIKAKLEARMRVLDEQKKSAKMLLFDAKVQYKSNEISEATFETVKSCTAELIEHVTHETAEISNVQKRIEDLEMDVQSTLAPQQKYREPTVSYLNDSEQSVQTSLPEAPTEPVPQSSTAHFEDEIQSKIPEPPQQVKSETSDDDQDNDWLARMEAQ